MYVREGHEAGTWFAPNYLQFMQTMFSLVPALTCRSAREREPFGPVFEMR